MMHGETSFAAAGCAADPASVFVPSQYGFPQPTEIFLILPLQRVAG